MITRESGKPNFEWYPKKASTAFAVQSLVYPDGSGAVQPADSTSGEHIGICQELIAATDDDYTGTRKIAIDVLDQNDIFRATVTGTLTAAKVGTYMDLSDASTVNAAATSKNVVLCVGFISATEGLFKLSANIANHYVATT